MNNLGSTADNSAYEPASLYKTRSNSFVVKSMMNTQSMSNFSNF